MAKQVKGNHTQNPNKLQKEFFIPCEVFRDENERMNSNFPSENCRYVNFGAKKVLVGYVETETKPSEDVEKYLKN